MSTTGQDIKERLRRGVETLPVDVEAQLRAVHRLSQRRSRRQRWGTAAVALAVAGAGLAMLWLAVPREGTLGGTASLPSGGIVYTSLRPDGSYGLHVVDPEQADRAGGDASVATPVLPGETAFGGVWSPDGKRMAYVSGHTDAPESMTLSVLDGETGSVTVLVAAEVSSPFWAPDGRRLAYIAGFPEGAVWIANADGTGGHRILEGQWRNVAWSPDGSMLLLAGWPNHKDERPDRRVAWEDTDIYTVRPDGSGLTRLTQGSHDDDYPAWSPDGTRIAFVRHQATGDNVGYPSDIVVMRADGSGLHIPTATLNTPPARKGFNGYPAWSPDGDQIVFSSDLSDPAPEPGFGEGFTASLWVMDPEGVTVQLLLEAQPGHVLAPSSWAG